MGPQRGYNPTFLIGIGVGGGVNPRAAAINKKHFPKGSDESTRNSTFGSNTNLTKGIGGIFPTQG